MSVRAKLLESIRSNPRSVRFEDACKVAVWLGFSHRGGHGSHRAFGRLGEPELLNFQNRDGYIAPYQARQSIGMMNKYGIGSGQVPD